MGITINISGGGAAVPTDAAATTTTVAALDAGASAASTPSMAASAAHSHGPDSTRDGGAPPLSLVHEVEAALLQMRGAGQGADASSSSDGISAGGAPV